MTSMTRTGFALLATCLLAGGLVAEDDDEAAPVVATADTKAPVTVASAHAGTVPLQIHALATVRTRPEAPTHVVAHSSGIVTRVIAHEGDHLTSGSLVAELDARPSDAALAKAQSAMRQARRDLEAAESGGLEATQRELDAASVKMADTAAQLHQEAARQEALMAKGLASEKAANEARAAAKAAQDDATLAAYKAARFRTAERAAQLAALRAALASARADEVLARLDTEGARIIAPADGILGQYLVHPGDRVENGAVIGDFQPDRQRALLIMVSPAEAKRISIGSAVALQGDAVGATAHVFSTGSAVDLSTGLVRVLADLDPTTATLPLGTTAPVTVDVGESPAGVIVPNGAVSYDEDQATVAIVDGTHAKVIPVTILARTSEETCVHGDGLAPTAQVIVDGNANLANGAGIVVREKGRE